MKKLFIYALSAAIFSSCGLYRKYERPTEIKTDGIYGDAQDGDDKGIGDLEW